MTRPIFPIVGTHCEEIELFFENRFEGGIESFDCSSHDHTGFAVQNAAPKQFGVDRMGSHCEFFDETPGFDDGGSIEKGDLSQNAQHVAS